MTREKLIKICFYVHIQAKKKWICLLQELEIETDEK